MFLLDWRLALFSLSLMPVFIWLTHRVGNERKRITTKRQGRMADMSALVAESLSVSGILLGKTMGRSGELAQRFEADSAELADIEVQSRMAGRWRMSLVQMSFSIMPALVFLFAGLTTAAGSSQITLGTLVAFTTLQTRFGFPIRSLLDVGIDIRTSRALFDRIFQYLDLPVEITERPDPVELCAPRGEVRFEHVSFRYDDDGASTLDRVDLVVEPGTTTAIVGETGSGKTTLGYLVARLYDVSGGRVTIDGVDVRDLSFDSLDAHGRPRLTGDLPLPRLDRRQPALRAAARRPTPSSWRPRAPPRSTT